MQLDPTIYGIVLLFIIGVCLIILGVAQLIANKLYPVRKPMTTHLGQNNVHSKNDIGYHE